MWCDDARVRYDLRALNRAANQKEATRTLGLPSLPRETGVRGPAAADFGEAAEPTDFLAVGQSDESARRSPAAYVARPAP